MVDDNLASHTVAVTPEVTPVTLATIVTLALTPVTRPWL